MSKPNVVEIVELDKEERGTWWAVMVNGYEEDCYPNYADAAGLAEAFELGEETPMRRVISEQEAAYIAGADQAVEDARAVIRRAMPHLSDEKREAYQAFRAAEEHARSVRLQVYGVTCPRCAGTGALAGKTPWDSHDCPVCKGWFKVMPEDAWRYAHTNRGG